MEFFGIGPLEVLAILVVALLFLGPERLPKIGRTLGRFVAEMRRASTELSQGLNREINQDWEGKRQETSQKGPPREKG